MGEAASTPRYLENIARVESLKKLLRPFIFSDQHARLILDPRVTDEEPVEGYVIAVSAPNNMLAFWRPKADAEDTLRRRQATEHHGEPGYLVSYPLDDVLDVEVA